MNATGRAPASDYAPFVATRGRAMAWFFVIATIIVFALVAFVFIPTGGVTGWTLLDKMMMFGLGLLIAAMLTRWAFVKAVPSEHGIVVRNLFLSRDVAWDEIVQVQFGGGKPWAVLDLTDTEQLGVMAIARSDGPRADAEAQRLATLVARHQSGVPNR